MVAAGEIVGSSVARVTEAIRVSAVVPAALLVIGSWTMLSSARSDTDPALAQSMQTLEDSTVLTVFLAIAILFVAAMIQPVQVGLVRFAVGRPFSALERPSKEGEPFAYGHRGRMVTFLIRHQQRSLQRARAKLLGKRYSRWPRRARRIDKPRVAVSPTERTRAGRRLTRFPQPEPDLPRDIRPTGLGNRLAALEQRVGRKYRFDLDVFGRYLFSVAPVTDAASQKRLIESYVGVSAASLTLTIPSIVLAVVAHPSYMLFFAGWLLLAWGTWAAACWTTGPYEEALSTLVDLWRFEVLKQFRIAMPPNLSAERTLFDSLALFLRAGPFDETARLEVPYAGLETESASNIASKPTSTI